LSSVSNSLEYGLALLPAPNTIANPPSATGFLSRFRIIFGSEPLDLEVDVDASNPPFPSSTYDSSTLLVPFHAVGSPSSDALSV
jgi:hypothetical protein